jgi:4-amino-4-deoxychorismate lyase
MICNSVIAVRRVARLEETTWPPAGWTDTLRTAFYEDVD